MKKTMYATYFNGNGYLSGNRESLFTNSINEAELFWSYENAEKNINGYIRGGKILTVEVSINIISENILESRLES